jgi:hypothetical protein
MEESSTIQGQTLLEALSALLLTLITVYAYLSCRAFAHRTRVVQAKPAVAGQDMLARRALAERQNSFPPSPARVLWEQHKSSIGDWLAPLIVWAVVIWTLLAVVAMMLGEG